MIKVCEIKCRASHIEVKRNGGKENEKDNEMESFKRKNKRNAFCGDDMHCGCLRKVIINKVELSLSWNKVWQMVIV